MDASTALDGDVPLTVSAARPLISTRGPVLSIARAEDGRQSVVVGGAGDAAARTVTLATPGGGALPFGVGDVVELRAARVAVSVFAEDRSVELRDAAGRVLAMQFDAAAAPEGWSASERGDGPGCFVVVRHGDTCAFASEKGWRRLDTPDGAFAIRARCAGAPIVGGHARPDHAPAATSVVVSRLK